MKRTAAAEAVHLHRGFEKTTAFPLFQLCNQLNNRRVRRVLEWCIPGPAYDISRAQVDGLRVQLRCSPEQMSERRRPHKVPASVSLTHDLSFDIAIAEAAATARKGPYRTRLAAQSQAAATRAEAPSHMISW